MPSDIVRSWYILLSSIPRLLHPPRLIFVFSKPQDSLPAENMKTDHQIIRSVLSEDDMERILCLWITVDESQWNTEKAARLLGSPSETFLESIRNMYGKIRAAYAKESKVYVDHIARMSFHLDHLEFKRGGFANSRLEYSLEGRSGMHAAETANEQVKNTEGQLVMRDDDAESSNRKRKSAQSAMEECVEKSSFKRSRRLIATSNVSM
ncbi:Hypothetical predicted protein [Lecanosticta acicola]|uniref:Uncharacterized protein n=1 Tax=Lecanosticta acicola TaxID=111012 RepID=A0AAI8Z2J7_9PEZI|nr:Hypothetical predicted protein [Lecanosticta acicola]